MCLSSAWTWINNNSEGVKIIFALAAAVFAGYQFLESKEDSRIKQTMELQAKFIQGSIQEAYRELNILLIDNKAIIDEAKNSPKKITEITKNNKREGDVLLLANFYAQVATCLKSGVCSKEVTCAAFATPVQELRNNFSDLFNTREKQWGENFIAPTNKYFSDHCQKINNLTSPNSSGRPSLPAAPR